jgi:RNA polymerase sigma-70 factor (ECF subfamily)
MQTLAPDIELVERHLNGDRSALGRILDAHEAALLRYATAVLGDAALAQDAVQETFLRLVREGERMRDVKALFPWLLLVARNVCHDFQRRRKRMDRKHDEARREAGPSEAPAPDAAALDGEARERVHAAVEALPDRQREVIRLKLWEGLTYREIARRLDMTLTNVSYHCGQALKSLAVRLRAEGLGA